MNVQELILELQKLPPDAEIVIQLEKRGISEICGPANEILETIDHSVCLAGKSY